MKTYNIYNTESDENFIIEGDFNDENDAFHEFKKQGHYNKIEPEKFDIELLPNFEDFMKFTRAFCNRYNTYDFDVKEHYKHEIIESFSVTHDMDIAIDKMFKEL